MTPGEWENWQEFAALEPFGPRQEELRAAAQCIFAAAAYRKADAGPMRPGDVFPSLKDDEDDDGQDDETIRRNMRAWVAVSNAAMRRGG